MGAAKPVRLSDNTSFDKAGDANDRYKAILNGGDLKVTLLGPEHQAVDVLYRDYCAATNWPMPGVPVSYYRDHNKEGTRSFYVAFSNGKKDDFSYIKAVRAIANKG